MRLHRFLRDLIAAATLHAYDTAKAQLRADLADSPEKIAEVLEAAVARSAAAASTEMRGDLERLTLFTVLFRSQADQSRRSDALDATLGVFLTALLVVGPFAFERSPTVLDRWVIGSGFVTATFLVVVALFFVGGREPHPALAAKLAIDLRSPDKGNYEAVVATINQAAKHAFYKPTEAEEDARGAAGDLAQLFIQDKGSLRLKRLFIWSALGVTILLSSYAGFRDVLYSSTEDPDASRISRQAVPAGPRSKDGNPGERPSDLRTGHGAAGLTLVLCGEPPEAVTTPYRPGALPLALSPTTIPEPLLCERWKR
jgi:hypothetical protein